MKRIITGIQIVEGGPGAIERASQELLKESGGGNVIGGYVSREDSLYMDAAILRVRFDSRTWTGLE